MSIEIKVGEIYLDREGFRWRVLATDRAREHSVVVLNLANGDVGTRTPQGAYASDRESHSDLQVKGPSTADALEAGQVAQLKKDLDEALVALRKIYEYRSDKPDWNMVMAIAGDVVEPMVVKP